MSMEMVAQVRDFSKSRGDARFLLTIIASYVNPYTGWAWPSLATLAHVTTKGKPYLLKLMHALEALGELEVRRGHGRGHPNHYRITICHERPPEPREKGNPSDDHFPGEKVIGEAEKVIDALEKGNPSDNPKEILERKFLERVAPEKVINQHPGEWVMENRVYGWHRVCGHKHQPGTPCYPLPPPEGAAGVGTGGRASTDPRGGGGFLSAMASDITTTATGRSSASG
jgi:hypothetical protein